MSDHHEFSAHKIFAYLIFYTAVEVLWGMFFPRDIQWALWGGLLLCAFLKGYLIFTWFMHMKFEGWIVKGLVLPTIPLIAILLFGNMPDSSFNDDLLHHIEARAPRLQVVRRHRARAVEEQSDVDALGLRARLHIPLEGSREGQDHEDHRRPMEDVRHPPDALPQTDDVL